MLSMQSNLEGVQPRFRRELHLTTWDKIRRFFFSKEEWEAYLLEKLEKQEREGKFNHD
jgi:hypothetical protein